MKINNITELIGNTPHLRLNRLYGDTHNVYVKLERQNPGASIKDRIALNMIEEAEKSGLLKPGGTIVEPTSGNTGIGLAMVAAVKGYKCFLTMPESMSVERRKVMAAYGATVVLTPKEEGVGGAIAKAKEIAANEPNSWIPQQFENPANPDVHRKTSAKEIMADFPEGVDVMITGVGTGGHITGTSEVLKEAWPNFKVYAVEPALSPILSGGEHSPHRLQGIGAGFVPDVMKADILDGIITVEESEAFEYAQRAASEEGLFIGISSGASLAAVAKKLPGCKRLSPHKA